MRRNPTRHLKPVFMVSHAFASPILEASGLQGFRVRSYHRTRDAAERAARKYRENMTRLWVSWEGVRWLAIPLFGDAATRTEEIEG